MHNEVVLERSKQPMKMLEIAVNTEQVIWSFSLEVEDRIWTSTITAQITADPPVQTETTEAK